MEGGAVICRDRELSDLFRLLRAHGWARNAKYAQPAQVEGIDRRYMFLNWGFNVRPTEPQAGFGLEQLKRVRAYHDRRIANAAYLIEHLMPYNALMRSMDVHPKAECSWFALPLVLSEFCPFTRSQFLKHLEKNGVETRPIVTGNVARQPVCRMFPELQDNKLPGADVVHERGFYMGIHPLGSREKLDRLLGVMRDFVQPYR